MKGEKADYVIPMEKVFHFPPKKRLRRALAVVRDFAKKHTRAKTILVSNEVNNAIHATSENLPRRIHTTILKEEDKVIVFMEKGKELEIYKKKKETEKKKAKKEENETKEKPKKEETPKESEAEKKLEEKKAKEKAAQAAEMKRK